LLLGRNGDEAGLLLHAHLEPTDLSGFLGDFASSPVGASTDRDAGAEASTDGGPSDDAASPASDAGEEAGAIGVLDCAWTSGSNCWKDTIAAAFGCLPPPGA
jgi:hypothetical protein